MAARASYTNAAKTVLLTKPEHSEEAHRLFSSTGIDIRSNGCRYLGGAIGERVFGDIYRTSMVEKWCKDLRILADIGQTQPQAAYAAFTKGSSRSSSSSIIYFWLTNWVLIEGMLAHGDNIWHGNLVKKNAG